MTPQLKIKAYNCMSILCIKDKPIKDEHSTCVNIWKECSECLEVSILCQLQEVISSYHISNLYSIS